MWLLSASDCRRVVIGVQTVGTRFSLMLMFFCSNMKTLICLELQKLKAFKKVIVMSHKIMILVFMLTFNTGLELASCAPDDPGVREPAVAGQFYPDEANRLTNAITAFMENARPAAGERPLAIVVPHAGYIYSGQIAADAYNQARAFDYDLIVILGTNHTTGGYHGVSIYSGEGYRTPLGVATIDRDVVHQLQALDKDFGFYAPVHQREHSVEVQVPFVQTLFPEADIVAAVVGTPDVDLCTRFGQALANVLAERNALIVTSSDLSHYPNYEDAVNVDHQTLASVTSLEPAQLRETVRRQMGKHVDELATCACGEGPILTTMVAAKALGANCGTLISYANSGDVAIGSHDRVVGYGAVTFSKSDNCPQNRMGFESQESGEASLSDTHKQQLLHLARQTIKQYLTSDTTPLPRHDAPALQRKQGAFVTLTKDGQLRGCIGHMAEDLPLDQVVSSMALQAAFNDRRFTPVRSNEMDDIELEISVLTPFEQVSGYDQIKVGRDGVVLEKDGRRAVFLPQVAPEQGWDRDTMLSHLARKAGLSADAWRNGATFYTFQAIVFAEHDFE